MSNEVSGTLYANIPKDIQIITGGKVLYSKNSDVDRLYNIQDIVFPNDYNETQVNQEKQEYIDFYKSNLIDANNERNFYSSFYRNFQVNTKLLNEDIKRYGELESIINNHKKEYIFQKNKISGDKINIRIMKEEIISIPFTLQEGINLENGEILYKYITIKGSGNYAMVVFYVQSGNDLLEPKYINFKDTITIKAAVFLGGDRDGDTSPILYGGFVDTIITILQVGENIKPKTKKIFVKQEDRMVKIKNVYVKENGVLVKLSKGFIVENGNLVKLFE